MTDGGEPATPGSAGADVPDDASSGAPGPAAPSEPPTVSAAAASAAAEAAVRRSRFWWWLPIGVAAVCAMAFTEIDGLLRSMNTAGSRSFGTGTFTGFKFNIGDVDDLQQAFMLWFGEPANLALAKRLVITHAAFDLAFIAAYVTMSARLLIGKLNVDPRFAWQLIVVMAAADVCETVLTACLAGTAEPATEQFVALQGLTLVKWLAVFLVLLTAATRYRPRAAENARNIQRSLNLGEPTLGPAVGTLTVVVAVFAALVALPAGGPLAQLPDVLRYQFTEAGIETRLIALGCIGLFIAVIAVAGHLATMTPRNPGFADQSEWVPFALAVLWTGLVWAADALMEGNQVGVATFTPAIVFAVIGIAWLVAPRLDIGGGAGSEAAGDGPDVDNPLNGGEATHRPIAHRIGALAGTVAVVAGLGLVRAATRPLLLDGVPDSWWMGAALVVVVVGCVVWAVHTASSTSSVRLPVGLAVTASVVLMASLFVGSVGATGMMWRIGVVGAGVALVGGFATEQVVIWSRTRSSELGSLRSVPLYWAVAVLAVAAAGVLVLSPPQARWTGTTGVVAVGLSVLALAAGGLSALSRRFAPWPPLERLGLSRPPWGVILIVIWLASSGLATEAGYHDARFLGPGGDRYPSLTGPSPGARAELAAFDLWVQAQQGCETVTPEGRSVYPMVLVAAPGGGIRAAYWSSHALTEMFGADPADQRCRGGRLFAVSGVSGGSVGTATWLAAGKHKTSAVATVAAMSRDEALASSMVGLFRDMVQPLVPLESAWDDRAELLEKGWERSAGCVFRAVPAQPDAPCDENTDLGWSHLGLGTAEEWRPVVVLNGSSVTDACRVLVANVANLTAAGGGVDCFAPAGDRPAGGGPLSGSTDAVAGLQPRGFTPGGHCLDAPGDLRVVTAALLSARFPFVSPSGALHRCVDDPSTEATGAAVEMVTYSVDGGYYENSGLLTVLQMWIDLAPAVQRHNLLADAGMESAFIEPWIVVVPNGYRSSALVKPPDRPQELVLPVSTRGQLTTVFGEDALMQTATAALEAFKTAPCGDGLPCFAPRSEAVRIGPTLAPSIAAPLGWVLSDMSRDELDTQLEAAICGDAVAGLRQALGIGPWC